MDEFVCGAGGEAVVILPVHVQRGCLVVSKLLLYLEGGGMGEGRREEEEGGGMGEGRREKG